MKLNSIRTPPLVVLLFLIALSTYSFFLLQFVWHDNLASFVGDSANYMLMGLYMSPWQNPSEPIRALWSYQDFPPFFPFILALTSAAHSMIAAHILTASFLIFSLPLLYYFSRQCFASTWQASGIVIIFSLSPSAWLNTKGILSENLYILISFITLIALQKADLKNIFTCLLLGLLFSILFLTRTIGVAMLAAFIIVSIYQSNKKVLEFKRLYLPVFTFLIIIITSKLLYKTSIPAIYLQIFDHLFNDLPLNSTFYTDFLGKQQLVALFDAWRRSWMYYWTDNLLLPQLIVTVIGILALIGLIIRLKQVKLDAIYVLFYLAILLVWPNPGQATRYLYPVLPLLLIYSCYVLHILLQNKNVANKTIAALLLLAIATVLPSLSYTWNRYHTGKEFGYHHITEYYRSPDLNKAKNDATLQLIMMRDMKKINSTTDPNDKILFYEPTYIALLADRDSDEIFITREGNIDVQHTNLSDENYIYLSKMHPKRTSRELDISNIKQSIHKNINMLWENHLPEENTPVTSFMKLSRSSP